jgi:hypothetical protein
MVRTANANLDPITEADTAPFSLSLTDGDGNAIDITGWTVWCTVKENQDDVDADATIQKVVGAGEHDDAANGETSFTFTSDDTADLDGDYYYDIQVLTDNNEIYTLVRGTVTFLEGYTDATAAP